MDQFLCAVNFLKNCSWTGKIFNISEYGPDSKEYFNPENWVVTPNLNAAVHSCSGSCMDEISQLQMRQFTKEKFKEGISDFKTIVGLSGVKTSFADYGAKMLGVIGEVGHYPEEFKKIKTFDHQTYSVLEETFFHQKTFQFFFV